MNVGQLIPQSGVTNVWTRFVPVEDTREKSRREVFVFAHAQYVPVGCVSYTGRARRSGGTDYGWCLSHRLAAGALRSLNDAIVRLLRERGWVFDHRSHVWSCLDATIPADTAGSNDTHERHGGDRKRVEQPTRRT